MKKYFGSRTDQSLNEYTYKHIFGHISKNGSFKNWTGVCFSNKRLKITCYVNKPFLPAAMPSGKLPSFLEDFLSKSTMRSILCPPAPSFGGKLLPFLEICPPKEEVSKKFPPYFVPERPAVFCRNHPGNFPSVEDLQSNACTTMRNIQFFSSNKGIGGRRKTGTEGQFYKNSRKAVGAFSTNTLQIVPTEYSLENLQRSNQDTSLTHKPAVFEGNWVQSGDLLTDCASSVGGELSLGQNLLIAYMPWEGYNFEDAILISERLVRDDLYTSVHIERYDIETYETKTGLEQITRDIPDITEKEMQHLDSFGIVKMGVWVEEGDILVGKVTPINKKTISPYQKLLYTILEKQIRPIRDSSLRAPKGIKAKVIDIKYFLRQSSFLTVGDSGLLRKAAMPSGKLPSKEEICLPSPSTKKEVEGTTNKKSKGINQNSKLLQKAGNFTPALMPAREFQLSKKKLENSVFFKKINNLFLKKMSKKEKLNFLRFYLFTRLDVKSTRSSRFNKSPAVTSPPSAGGQRMLRIVEAISLQRKSSKKEGKHNKLPSFGGAAILDEGKQEVTAEGSKNYKTLSKKYKQRSGPFLKNKLLHNIESIHIYLAEKRKIQVGDKMAGRHGNKGIVSQILPIIDMPFLPDGTPLDMVLNPLGVPSRMNVGQIYECLLGLAGKFLGENYKVFSFDEIYGPEASRSFVFNKLYQARLKTGFQWLFDPSSPGKMRLYDGRTGESFDQKVTVGQAYILRLVHMVDDKIHMRSTGPYSLVTQQPLRGRSKQGGQRLGEMEVWAIEGYGAAFTLLEMLTIKSDDMTGRMTLWSNLILNKDISIGTPESFKVLICELQALCLDIGLFRYMDTTTKNHNSLREITSLVNLP